MSISLDDYIRAGVEVNILNELGHLTIPLPSTHTCPGIIYHVSFILLFPMSMTKIRETSELSNVSHVHASKQRISTGASLKM